MSARILVVDDEPDLEPLMIRQFRVELRAGEVEFAFAHDGIEALSELEREPDYDMVLCDINMPNMDGLTLLGHISEGDPLLKTVMVSAYGDMTNIRTAMNRGAFDFVTKPIEFDDLKKTIEKTLREITLLRESIERREAAEQAKANLSRYFSPNLAQELAENPEFLKLGGERRELTFVFTDLADFTPLVETLDSTLVVPLLNEYLGGMTRIVFRHGGTMEKIVGDAVHVIFGAPMDQVDHAIRGVACAMEMDSFAETFRKKKNGDGLPVGVTRIGVHSGPAIVGNFGGDLFFDYTAYGDAINTAARLEGVNKFLGTRICVSQEAVNQIPNFKGRQVGTLVLKGKSEGVKVYQPLDAELSESLATEAYRAAFAKLEKGDAAASQSFAALVGQYGDDPLATFHLKRLLAGETGVEIAFREK